MKSIKLALMAGAAIAVSAAAAQADDLEALKAQIETLNARVAAMETAPAVPAGYSLLAISEGELQQTPGLDLTAQEKFSYGNKSTIISVLPTADAPAGATISWSGYARAGLVYQTQTLEVTLSNDAAGSEDRDISLDPEDETDVRARGQIRVTAATDTAVGEIGVDIRARGNFDGVGQTANTFFDVAWGYWAMTPELTLGGGYAGSLGNVGYGFDGACNCYYNNYGDIDFNPGDTTQFRLAYASGPLSMAVALEDASYDTDSEFLNEASDNQLGVAGEIRYSGDSFNGEISAVYRSLDDDNENLANDPNPEFLPSSIWQVGAGVGFNLGEMAALSIGAAMGQGPFIVDPTNEDNLTTVTAWENNWWGVSAIASANLSDEISAEIGGGYKSRDFADVDTADLDASGDYSTWSIAGGIYYQPVDQLTIGVESAYWVADWTIENYDAVNDVNSKAEFEADSFTVDLVSVWRF
jgi:hypothetical protein